jgi:hypothetical protein
MSTQICRGLTDKQWPTLKTRLIKDGDVLNDEAAWGCAIKVFERRIAERFLTSIEALARADSPQKQPQWSRGVDGDQSQVVDKDGERGRNRTSNLLIKSQLLCQLSYAPTVGIGY